ncbi:MAG: hypothetical protein ACRD3O_22075 [Terriglobia bacterium]
MAREAAGKLVLKLTHWLPIRCYVGVAGENRQRFVFRADFASTVRDKPVG